MPRTAATADHQAPSDRKPTIIAPRPTTIAARPNNAKGRRPTRSTTLTRARVADSCNPM